LGVVPVLSGKRKWWGDAGKPMSEHVLCCFIYFKFQPKLAAHRSYHRRKIIDKHRFLLQIFRHR
jgi:hypothetical protein